MDIVERLREHNEPPFDYIAHEAAAEIEQLRKDKQRGFELMDALIIRVHRLRQSLYRIANMKHDEDFGLPPIGDAMKIAQDALEEE
jgi:mevalonate kinase